MVDDCKLETDVEDHEIESDDFVVDDCKLETDIEDHENEVIIL